MFDELVDNNDAGSFDEKNTLFESERGRRSRRHASAASPRFMGMTARQRFILSMMLLLAVCSLGSMCLLITGKIAF